MGIVARKPNDFLILSNDLHEIRILDRAIRFASAEVVCLVQDDDEILAGGAWLENALAKFRQYENLAILGGTTWASMASIPILHT